MAASGVGLAALVPMSAFGPLAGVFVDRCDKRTTMLAMDAIRAVLVAVLILAAPAKWYGFLAMAMGIGVLGRDILVTTLAQRIGLVRTLNVSMLGLSASIFVYSQMTSFTPALLGMQFGQIDAIFTRGAVIAIAGTAFSVFRLGFRDPLPCFAPTAPVVPASLPAAVPVAE